MDHAALEGAGHDRPAGHRPARGPRRRRSRPGRGLPRARGPGPPGRPRAAIGPRSSPPRRWRSSAPTSSRPAGLPGVVAGEAVLTLALEVAASGTVPTGDAVEANGQWTPDGGPGRACPPYPWPTRCRSRRGSVTTSGSSWSRRRRPGSRSRRRRRPAGPEVGHLDLNGAAADARRRRRRPGLRPPAGAGRPGRRVPRRLRGGHPAGRRVHLDPRAVRQAAVDQPGRRAQGG